MNSFYKLKDSNELKSFFKLCKNDLKWNFLPRSKHFHKFISFHPALDNIFIRILCSSLFRLSTKDLCVLKWKQEKLWWDKVPRLKYLPSQSNVIFISHPLGCLMSMFCQFLYLLDWTGSAYNKTFNVFLLILNKHNWKKLQRQPQFLENSRDPSAIFLLRSCFFFFEAFLQQQIHLF